jgi:Tfp pilus assembly protein PilV
VPRRPPASGGRASFRTAPRRARRRTPRCATCAGFTILEVALAAFVLALAIATSVTAMQQAYFALDRARKITLAGQVMQSEFEKMRLNDWATVSSYPALQDITDTIDPTFRSESSAITNSFTVSRAVTEVHAGMKQVTLTTNWRTLDGRTSSKSYSTYYGKDGLYDFFYNSY